MSRLLLIVLAVALATVGQAQEPDSALRKVGVSAFFPHIPREDFDSVGLSVNLRLGSLDRPYFLDLDFRGYHAAGQDVFVFNPSLGYAHSWGRLTGLAQVGLAFGGSSGGKSKMGLSGTLGLSHPLGRNLSLEARYVFVGPDGLGGFLVGLTLDTP
ncbi:hypothetical protein EON82_15625 [bacterium]|nr:MAG: hypothetical protein EON82_15625 [bacterium]